MSALGHKRTLKRRQPMSALPPKADIAERKWHVRFVPKGHSALQQKMTYSITSARRCGARARRFPSLGFQQQRDDRD
jgi:hypothetical protein